jgi:hypothetical protein
VPGSVRRAGTSGTGRSVATRRVPVARRSSGVAGHGASGATPEVPPRGEGGDSCRRDGSIDRDLDFALARCYRRGCVCGIRDLDTVRSSRGVVLALVVAQVASDPFRLKTVERETRRLYVEH